MASSRAWENPTPPQLLLVAMILTPRSFMSFTYSRQSIASLVGPDPEAFRNLHAMRRTVQLTPTTPTPLFPTAPIVPATWLPWSLSSKGLESLLRVSMPKQSSIWPLPSSSMPLLLQSRVLRNMFADRSWWL